MTKRTLLLFLYIFFQSILFGQNKKFKIYISKKNETLKIIAKRHFMSLEDLQEHNKDLTIPLEEGQEIKVPLDKLPQKKKKVRRYIYHFVKPKETLYSLSKRYNLSIFNLLKENSFLDKGLKIGDTLTIPLAIDTTQYKLHFVEKKQTVFSLLKKYNITKKQLYDANPFLLQGLKYDQYLLIPKNKPLIQEEHSSINHRLKKENIIKEYPILGSNYKIFKNKKIISFQYKLHFVEKKQTVFSILKKYNITKEQLYEANPFLSQGLKYDQYLLIPKNKPLVQEEHSSINHLLEKENVIKEDSILNANYKISKNKKIISFNVDSVTVNPLNVALMLPFYLQQNDTIKPDMITGKKSIFQKSKVALEFYTGVLCALDSLKDLGFSINVNVYDTGNDVEKLDNILKNNDFTNIDIILGPLYTKNIQHIANYLKNNNIKTLIVSPLSIKKDLETYPYVIQVNPNNQILSDVAIDYFKKNYNKENVVLVYTPKMLREMKIIEKHISTFVDSLKLKNLFCLERALHKDSILDYIKPFEKHTFILSTDDNVITSDLISNLYSFQDTAISKVILLKKSNIIDKLESDYLSYVNLHYPSPYHIDYLNESTKKMIKRYRKKNKKNPDKYALIGFDITLDILIRYAINDFKNITKGIYSNFNYLESGSGGYVNNALYMIEYKDLRKNSIPILE